MYANFEVQFYAGTVVTNPISMTSKGRCVVEASFNPAATNYVSETPMTVTDTSPCGYFI